MKNNPLRYTDPSGHYNIKGPESNEKTTDHLCLDQKCVLNYQLKMYGVSAKGNWSTKNLKGAKEGVRALAKTFSAYNGKAATKAFRDVYGSITFQWEDGACDNPGGNDPGSSCYADAYLSPGTIRFWAKSMGNSPVYVDGEIIYEYGEIPNPPVTAYLAIHELSHVLDLLSGRLGEALVQKYDIDRTGLHYSQSREDTDREIFADVMVEEAVFRAYPPDKYPTYSNGVDQTTQVYLTTDLGDIISAAETYR